MRIQTWTKINLISLIKTIPIIFQTTLITISKIRTLTINDTLNSNIFDYYTLH